MTECCRPLAKTLCLRDTCRTCEPRRLSNCQRFLNHPESLSELQFLNGLCFDARTSPCGAKIKISALCHKKTCGHRFVTLPVRIFRGNWCPYCDGKLCEDEECQPCFKRSCANVPLLVKHWSTLNSKTPRQINNKSGHKAKFFCCREFEAPPVFTHGNVNRSKSWCPCCTGQKCCGDENCVACWNKSFAINPASKYWDYDLNEDSPHCVSKCNIAKRFMKCPKSLHPSHIISICNAAKGHGCPMCVRKSEALFRQFHEDQIGSGAYYEKTFASLVGRSNYSLRFDCCFDMVITEIDGLQHFVQVDYFGKTLAEVQATDLRKERHVMNLGYNVVRIFQPDIFTDKNNWKNLYIQVLDEIRDSGCKNMSILIREGNVIWTQRKLD